MIRAFLTFMITMVPALAVVGEPVQFNRDIRPILTKHCTACHGGVKEAGGISFIHRESALGEGESGARPIVPGKPAESEMLRRIRSIDPDEVMPQPKHGPPLSAAEASLIERWISEGGEWQHHWSFEAPKETKIAVVSNESWPAVPLDRFILQRLDRENLKPSPEADPAEWLRRASFDLTGLPPTPEELANYQNSVADDPAAARVAVVDRLLASPHYGERWAAVWLDLARYADTYGFEKDPHRDIWPFRDWVIRAFNADMPYDQFTIEQLAGDLLPGATAQQRLATAFHRNTQTNTEGGTDDEEFRVAAVIDRVNTTWTTWQATTFGCVQCHSHPYDPISHEEFYQFVAFFNNTEDFDQDDDFPRMKLAGDPAKIEETSAMEMQLRVLREQLNQAGRSLAESGGAWQPFTPAALTPSHGKLEMAADGTIRATGTFPRGSVYKISGAASAFTALRLRILPESDDPKKWPERGSLVTRFEVKLIDPAGVSAPVVMKEVFVDRLGGPKEPEPNRNVGGFPKLEGPRWAVFVPDRGVQPAAGAQLEISMAQDAQTAGAQGTPVRRFAIDLSNHNEWSKLIGDEQRAGTWKSYLELKQAHQAVKGTMVPVMVEGPVRQTRMFAGGNRLAKDKEVTAGVPRILAGGKVSEGMNRLDMARWIASRENPLTARVMVNRLWGELFGTGIVPTVEDFGSSGVPPTHPDLLDHLALRFQNDFKWSVKAMLRELVLSATYRQTHRVRRELVERDPSNLLLARGPRNRLSAEMVRDQALVAAGLLSPVLHGPPVYPPQPDGVWNSVYSGMQWKESEGGDRLRRGLYTYAKRTSGFPGFLTFDAPSRDLCSARRLVSNTPLQALVTLNDPAHIEAAQGLAGRMRGHSAELPVQLAFGVLLATQRTASPEMVAELVSLHADLLEGYEAAPAESAKLAEGPSAAALVLTANTILNLDSALTR